MKKRFLAFACAAVLTFGMSMTAFAASSPTGSGTASSNTASAAEAADDSSSSADTTSSTEVLVKTASGQAVTPEVLSGYVSNTTLSTSVSGASIAPVGNKAAVSMIAAAYDKVGANAVIATMVDISVPEGTGTATFTLGVPSLVAGQSVTVLHLKSSTEWEVLPVSAVGNGTVTFTMSSYSPVAVVLNATAPKTGEANMAVILMIAAAGIAGAAVCGGRFARS
ncbi:MAG: hypothetical protein NC331_05220 [Lachnospiraceae bacterium]|nr:hypothetical protein [Lachnospiraceae bacterium]MCM1238767.1 hypothetical protein [Lachnospiraceae bacterium]